MSRSEGNAAVLENAVKSLKDAVPSKIGSTRFSLAQRWSE